MKKIVGLITEYNPLHNGHLYHINEVKKKANPDVLIAVISSSFTMRGDLSLFDKFTKAKQALKAGIDIIIELPFTYTLHRADIFANNAVSFLNELGVNEIWIGSEENDTKIYEKYYNEIKEKSNYIIDEYKSGISYKASFGIDLKSNDILGYSYYKSIKDNNYNIKLNTIKRIANDYLDTNISHESIASALAIRTNKNLLAKYTPEYVYSNKDKILDENLLFPYIKYKILSSSIIELKDIFFSDEGLENKLKDITKFNSLNEFIDYLANKRYTKTRIKRLLIYILANVKKTEINEIYNNKINFVRVLGYSDIGQAHLKEYKKNTLIYTNIKDNINKALDIELRISRILDSIYNLELFKQEQSAPIKLETSH